VVGVTGRKRSHNKRQTQVSATAYSEYQDPTTGAQSSEIPLPRYQPPPATAAAYQPQPAYQPPGVAVEPSEVHMPPVLPVETTEDNVPMLQN